MRFITNYYLLTMALSDIIYITLVVVDKVARFSTSPIASDYKLWAVVGGCKFFISAVFIPLQISQLCILCYTIERYVAVCKPLSRLTWSSPQRTKLMIAMICISSLVLIAPCTYFAEGKTYCLEYARNISTTNIPDCILKCGAKPVTFRSFSVQCHAMPFIPYFIVAGK